jgi:ABC-type multidrug transport system permease subunit
LRKREDAARSFYKWTNDFLDWVWDRGALGKAAITLWFLVLIAPPIFNAYAIFFLFRLYPTAVTLTERLAVLSILTALANAEALWLNYILFQSMVSAYVGRRRRRRRETQARLEVELRFMEAVYRTRAILHSLYERQMN